MGRRGLGVVGLTLVLSGCATVNEQRITHLGEARQTETFGGFDAKENTVSLEARKGRVVLSYSTGSTCFTDVTTTTPRTIEVVRTGTGGAVARAVTGALLGGGTLVGLGLYGAENGRPANTDLTATEWRTGSFVTVGIGVGTATVLGVVALVEAAHGADSVEPAPPLVETRHATRRCEPQGIAERKLELVSFDGTRTPVTTLTTGRAFVPTDVAASWLAADLPRVIDVDLAQTYRPKWTEPVLELLAQHLDTAGAWQLYLREFPQGPRAAGARRRVGELEGSARFAAAGRALDEKELERARSLFDEGVNSGASDEPLRVRLVAAEEAVKAAEQERQRQRDAQWGPFSEFRARAKNRDLVGLLRQLGASLQRRAKMQELADRERHKNDDAAREEDVQVLAYFPEVSGQFTYLKALDHDHGEALFMANDGAFVMRLSPGDSFSAYPGQLVRLTMHNRGERMLMTTGKRLPVFISGASPTHVRRIPGFVPNRTRERALEKRIDAELKASLALMRRQAGAKEGESEGMLLRFPAVQLSWSDNGDATAELRDEEGHIPYCIELGHPCSGAMAESVSLEQLLEGK